MTRINCVPVSELTSKHLVAEYRELPRVFGLVRECQNRGVIPSTLTAKQPPSYVMGEGHVIFFYTRLGYIERRYIQLVKEMKSRGYIVNYPEPNLQGIGECWCGDWEPDEAAMKINRARIKERIDGQKQ